MNIKRLKTLLKKTCRFLFQNGVDVILGTHPHVLEPMEKRTVTLEDGTTKDGFVIYSLGNFIADKMLKYKRLNYFKFRYYKACRWINFY